jgi:hypothetical protein
VQQPVAGNEECGGDGKGDVGIELASVGQQQMKGSAHGIRGYELLITIKERELVRSE